VSQSPKFQMFRVYYTLYMIKKLLQYIFTVYSICNIFIAYCVSDTQH